MILIDTSAWIDFFRGQGACCALVDNAIESNEAALCGPVITELERGIRSKGQRQAFLKAASGCLVFEQPVDLWLEAGEIGCYVAKKGFNVKTFDLLIATFSLYYSAEILTRDSDFLLIQKAGIAIQLFDLRIKR